MGTVIQFSKPRIKEICLKRLKELAEEEMGKDFDPLLSWKLEVFDFMIQEIEANDNQTTEDLLSVAL